MWRNMYGKNIAGFFPMNVCHFVASTTVAAMFSTMAVAQQFGQPVLISPLTQPCCVFQTATLDMNGDGLEDILLASGYYPLQNASIPIQILLNAGGGNFVDGTAQVFSGPVPRTVFPRGVIVKDLNGDGVADVFIADHGYDAAPFPGAQNTLILSMPNGHYADASGNLPQQLDFTHSATAADIDGSGRVAIYSGNIWGQQEIGPQLLLNDGTGHFTISTGRLPPAQIDLNQNRYVSSLFVDVTDDGCVDLVLGGDQNTQSVVLKNDCQGHFSVLANALPPKLFADGITVDIKTMRLGNSGKPDLLLVTTHGAPFYVGRAIQVLVNNGDGTFHDESASRVGLRDDTGNWVVYAKPTLLDGDCQLDLFLQTNMQDHMIFTSDGAGNFNRMVSGLPNLFAQPQPIRLDAARQKGFISVGGNGFYRVSYTGSICAVPHNFNGDDTSDILWRDSSNGNAVVSTLNDGRIKASKLVASLPPGWTIAAAGDFNGDRKSDLLWRDASGNTVVSIMNGNGAIQTSSLLVTLPSPWAVAGTGDFNNDGRTDILWRDGSNGNTVVSLVNGDTISGSTLIVTLPSPWSVAGVGDFNNDGSADIVWSNQSTGDTVISLVNSTGTAIASSTFIVNLPPTAWTVAGVGDFNGDARSDILWRNSSGDTVVSLIGPGGASIASSTLLTRLGAPWSLAVLGDFNADGRSDILWQNTSGATVASFIGAGGTTIASSALIASVPANWHVMGVNQN